MGSHGAATKWGLLDASNEVSYAMRHPGGADDGSPDVGPISLDLFVPEFGQD